MQLKPRPSQHCHRAWFTASNKLQYTCVHTLVDPAPVVHSYFSWGGNFAGVDGL